MSGPADASTSRAMLDADALPHLQRRHALSMSAPSESIAERSWRPDTETKGGWAIGGGVPPGKGVAPVNFVDYKGESITRLPFEDATWDYTERVKQWQEWRKSHPKDKPPPSIAAMLSGRPLPIADAQPVRTDLPPPNTDSRQWSCKPVGACSACPEDSLHFPYCQPYGNRVAVLCSPLTSGKDAASLGQAVEGWQQCGKSTSKERQDYFEFTAFTALAAVAAFLLFIRRQKLLSERQYAALNQRINS